MPSARRADVSITRAGIILAITAAELALQIDESSGLAHMALGIVDWIERDGQRTEATRVRPVEVLRQQ